MERAAGYWRAGLGGRGVRFTGNQARERASELTGEEMNDIALRGRDFMDAVGLLPGVIDISDSREAPSPRSIGDLYILGGRSNSKNMTIDGVTNMVSTLTSSTVSTPGGRVAIPPSVRLTSTAPSCKNSMPKRMP